MIKKVLIALVILLLLVAFIGACSSGSKFNGDSSPTSFPSVTSSSVVSSVAPPSEVAPTTADTLSPVDHQMVTRVRSVSHSGLTSLTDDNIVKLAYAACDDLNSGDSLADTVQDGLSIRSIDPSIEPYDIGVIIGAGIYFYCPQYTDLIPTN